MATIIEGGERQHPPEPDNLPCPRCDSTSTKFCYYNNYNLSQPRYFCKSCRRFWTRGGTLRNIPVGGGSRKNSKPKRSRSSSSAAASTVTPLPPPPPAVVNTKTEIPSPLRNDDVEFDLNDEGSFTSLLLTATDDNNAAVNGGGPFMNLPGYGFGLGHGFGVGSLGFEEIGFGFGALLTDDENKVVGQNDGSETWRFGSGDGVDGPDCFGWSEVAISTSGQGLE